MFKIDPHIHTSETSPCAAVPGAIMANQCKQAGYDAIIITDHYSVRSIDFFRPGSWEYQVDQLLAGYRAAKTHGDQIGLTVLFGIEYTNFETYNDYLIYGVTEKFLLTHPGLHEMPMEIAWPLFKKQGCFIVQAHPFRPGMTPLGSTCLDGIEAFNANMRHDSHNDKSLAWAKEHNLLPTAGSDSHQLEDVGRAGLELERPVATIDEFITALRSKKYRMFTHDPSFFNLMIDKF